MELVNLSVLSNLKHKEVNANPNPAKFPRAKVKNVNVISSCKTVVENCDNFSKSGLPHRIMYYCHNEWKDFSPSVLIQLIDAFRCGRTMVEVSSLGHNYLLDFLRMSFVNLESGTQQHVAWIDVTGQCFFPSQFSDLAGKIKQNKGFELKLLVDIDEDVNTNCEYGKNGLSNRGFLRYGVKEVIAENGDNLLKTHCPKAGSFGAYGKEMVVELESCAKEYLSVQNVFLKGLSDVVSLKDVVGIYRYSPSSYSAKSRLQLFEKQIDITRNYRGDPNIKNGWYGSSREGLLGVLRHGFALHQKSLDGGAYGTGIYFAPEDCANVSVNDCDVDENGVQHMVLCRIIMGRVEQIPSGSDQFHPSTREFDSGVDRVHNTKFYVVWPTHMNTHVHPKYIVSFKLSSSKCEISPEPKIDIGRSNEVFQESTQICTPTSAWIPFPLLFSLIQSRVQSKDQELLCNNFNEFKHKRMTRKEFVRRLRSIVGDDLLLSTLRRYHLQPPSNSGAAKRGLNVSREVGKLFMKH